MAISLGRVTAPWHSAAVGNASEKATTTRRTLMRIWAPILSSFRRMVPDWEQGLLGVREGESAQGAEQDIGEGGEVQENLVGAQGVGAGAVGEQVKLLLLG